MEKSKKRSLFKNTVMVVVILLLVFAFAGSEILSIFEIQISSFMIAGVLLFIVAIEFLTHGEWRTGGGSMEQDSGIVPLAFPLLSGPGALTIALISFQSAGGLVTLIAILIVTVITYLVLLASEPINKILGKRGSLIVTRVFAIFLAAFAIQFMINGINEIFH